ncbi:MAG TPA: hypothetical protein P5191_16505 [Ruminococcus sp.]|nr:hypothetical protein [Ruminococcus sp.]
MRVLMTPEIAKLYDEVKPYLDEHYDLVPDAPEDIKAKNAMIDAYMDAEYQKNEKMNR